MKNYVIKILINGVGVYVASILAKPHIEFTGHGIGLVGTVLLVALIFGLLNTFLRPIVKLFSMGLLIVTLGLFTFVINALMLWLTSKISEHFSVAFHVENFLFAIIGAVIATATSLILHALLPDDKKK
ncbi:MAG TPA: phage holin family protein [Actinocrinis sp.]|uniref:phage holin family protein n=1 Tax=Actinocrinis sp. TaxID=1920516 RepID=UPI002DDD1A72|nr:phage holin family protein [Actinocrinis sp.]HEV2345584.1 phage holin family protein [Actinocrinis sp.]